MAQLGHDVRAVQTAAANADILAAAAADWMTIWVETHHQPETTPAVWAGRSKGASAICSTKHGQAAYIDAAKYADAVVIKNRYNAFLHTNLELMLRTAGIERVVFCGCTTNVCVESSARHAFMLDFETVTIADASGAYSTEEHDAALHNLSSYFGSVLHMSELNLHATAEGKEER